MHFEKVRDLPDTPDNDCVNANESTRRYADKSSRPFPPNLSWNPTHNNSTTRTTPWNTRPPFFEILNKYQDGEILDVKLSKQRMRTPSHRRQKVIQRPEIFLVLKLGTAQLVQNKEG